VRTLSSCFLGAVRAGVLGKEGLTDWNRAERLGLRCARSVLLRCVLLTVLLRRNRAVRHERRHPRGE